MPVRLTSPLHPVPMAVTRVGRDTPSVVTLSIRPPDAGFDFLPGQFNMLYVYGIGEVPISMSGDPRRRGVIVHTVKAAGAVTAALCRARRGDVLGVRGPYGVPWPVTTTGRDLLIIAGGVGLAPLRPLICHVARQRAAYGEVTLLVGARTPGDLLFTNDLIRWQTRYSVRVVTTVDQAAPGWKGRVGVAPDLLGAVPFSPDRTVAYVCGPEVMMRFTVRELARRGLRDDQIFLSLERNMKCAVGLCGRCQFGPEFVCRTGPVFRFDRIRARFWMREV
jgi:NAD(P)H-flavin reductase